MPQLNRDKNNNYIKNPKDSTIETPSTIGKLFYDYLHDNRTSKGHILDIGCNRGNLSLEFYNNGYNVKGIDIRDFSSEFHSEFHHKDFLKIINYKEINDIEPDLILMNSPWNNPGKPENPNKYLGRIYLPELFLKQIIKLFGMNIKIAMLTSFTLLMNQDINSKRLRWMRDCCAPITSILDIPKNFFPKVKILNHILFFNICDLPRHWFIPEKYIDFYKKDLI